MTETLFELVPQYGFWIILLCTFLSCLAVPIPSSFIMLAAGAFVVSGDLGIVSAFGGAWLGAVLGDQVGFWAARLAGERLTAKANNGSGSLAKPMNKAKTLIEEKGGLAVFLSRWLLSPMGPYVNLFAGLGGMTWSAFSIWGALGEVIWVTIYLTLGAVFASQITQVADIAGSLIGLITSAALAWGLGRAAIRRFQSLRDAPEPA